VEAVPKSSSEILTPRARSSVMRCRCPSTPPVSAASEISTTIRAAGTPLRSISSRTPSNSESLLS
jgi:hypothetical protein